MNPAVTNNMLVSEIVSKDTIKYKQIDKESLRKENALLRIKDEK
jgi:hypothetical protein